MSRTEPPADPAPGSDIHAAGAVVLRKRNGGEVLLVHRPRYDDWAWPKGKLDPGEHTTAAAVREVLEETGVEVTLGRPLPPQVYAVASGRTKVVRYWVGRAVGDKDVSGYTANDEIDQVGWFGLDKARRMLTYADDIDLLDEVSGKPGRTRALVIVRHARAVKRSTWTGPDPKRGLTEVGRDQALSLIPVLSAYGVTRVLTSDAVRCQRTVAPYARDHVLPVEELAGLNEVDSTPRTISDALGEALASRENTVLCSHRPVLPQIFARLGVEEEPLAPGELVVCHHRRGRIVATERHLVR